VDPPAVGFAKLTPEANKKYPVVSPSASQSAGTGAGPSATGSGATKSAGGPATTETAVFTNGAGRHMPSLAAIAAALLLAM
jgi:hypothetical protein